MGSMKKMQIGKVIITICKLMKISRVVKVLPILRRVLSDILIMINKFRIIFFALLISLFGNYSIADNEIKFEVGDSACIFESFNGRQFYIGIRGVDDYWLEYIDQQSLVLLMHGKSPLFHSQEDYSCAQDKIVSFIKVPFYKKNEYLNFDCHIVGDQPYSLGQIIFGYVSEEGVGLKPAAYSWMAYVNQNGSAFISPVPINTKVMCLVLPPIDNE